ncbi:MFS transporter [Weizmannia acidilactici]|uniref:MFS transporter n=1 Tax=Weizmannia acidilactici TaxID=2607726 RepID=A0A5J4JIS2_9BACI|nr:MFS transporter [Weizmannia acidilactici]GER67079.1 MFS transporter [Weizmannia acidilactici]GER70317.1 MFS transporter [Weizmannia acidilactici]GER73561.1 MFS transporter [Weizmannia acidilactici]
MNQTIGNQLDMLSVGKAQKRATAVIGLGLFFEFFELFLAGVLSSVLGEEFHVSASLMPLLLGSSFLGMFIGAIFLSNIADRYGRKRAFMLNVGIYSFFTLFIAFSPNVGTVIFFRFLAGMGLGAQPALCDTYLSELIPSAKRGKYIAWAYTIGFLAVPVEGFLSRALVPLSPFGMEGWRWVFMIGAAGGVIALMAARALPESPRWLASKGRIREAGAMLEKFWEGGKGVGPFPEVQAEPADKAPQGNLLGAVFQKRFLKSTVMLYIFQIFQTVGYFGFGTLAPLVLASKGYTVTHSLEYIALSFIGYPLGSLLSVPLIERMDRKWLVCLSAFCMGVFGILFGIGGSPSLIIVFGFAYTLCSNIFSNAFHVLQAEIFPTEIRASATGMAYSISRIMSGLMPFVLLPVLENEGAAVMFVIVAAAMLIVILDIALLAPKTTGRPLENIGDAYDPHMIGETGMRFSK